MKGSFEEYHLRQQHRRSSFGSEGELNSGSEVSSPSLAAVPKDHFIDFFPWLMIGGLSVLDKKSSELFTMWPALLSSLMGEGDALSVDLFKTQLWPYIADTARSAYAEITGASVGSLSSQYVFEKDQSGRLESIIMPASLATGLLAIFFVDQLSFNVKGPLALDGLYAPGSIFKRRAIREFLLYFKREYQRGEDITRSITLHREALSFESASSINKEPDQSNTRGWVSSQLYCMIKAGFDLEWHAQSVNNMLWRSISINPLALLWYSLFLVCRSEKNETFTHEILSQSVSLRDSRSMGVDSRDYFFEPIPGNLANDFLLLDFDECFSTIDEVTATVKKLTKMFEKNMSASVKIEVEGRDESRRDFMWVVICLSFHGAGKKIDLSCVGEEKSRLYDELYEEMWSHTEDVVIQALYALYNTASRLSMGESGFIAMMIGSLKAERTQVLRAVVKIIRNEMSRYCGPGFWGAYGCFRNNKPSAAKVVEKVEKTVYLKRSQIMCNSALGDGGGVNKEPEVFESELISRLFNILRIERSKFRATAMDRSSGAYSDLLNRLLDQNYWSNKISAASYEVVSNVFAAQELSSSSNHKSPTMR